MDEAYSLGLASYNKVEIQNNEDFYNIWHNKEYYEDYLAVNDDEISNYTQVYINQKNDVHPPLYYLLLRITMSFSPNHFSKWTGIIINIIIFAFITIFMFLILNKLLEEKNIKNGVVIFLNEGQDNDKILEKIRETTNLETITHLKRMNACDIYYIK